MNFPLKKLLEKNQLVGIDATNLNRLARQRWLKLVRAVNPDTEIVLLWHTSNYDSPQRWHQERGHLPEEYLAIRGKLEQIIELPSEEEGFKIEYI